MIGLIVIAILALAIAAIAWFALDKNEVAKSVVSCLHDHLHLITKDYIDLQYEIAKVKHQLKIANKLAMEREQPRCGVCSIFVSKVDHEAHPGICSRCSTKKNREIKKQVLRDNPVDGVSEYAVNAGVEY